MQIARRVYIYLITFISLQMLLVGAANLLRLVFEVALDTTGRVVRGGDYRREQFSLWGALLLVGAAVWGVHWFLAQRSVAAGRADADEERRSILRKLLVYGVLVTTLWQVFFALSRLVRGVLAALPALDSLSLRASLSAAAPQLLIYGCCWAYYHYVRHADAAATPERGGAATVRRWYVYLANFGALTTLMLATARLARYLWRAATAGRDLGFTGDTWAPAPVAGDIGWIAAGVAVWLLHWLAAQRLVAVAEDEQHAVLRKVYLYAVIFQTVAVALTNLAFFLYNLVRRLIGSDPLSGSGDPLLTAAGVPLLTALIYGVFWAYHQQVLAWDAALVAAEPPRQASIRRLYSYLVALIGLTVLASGLASMLRLLFDFALGGDATTNLSRRAWGDAISFFATLIAVGGPVWALHWERLQRRALAPGGEEERQAILRRIYLFLVLFFSVIALLTSLAWLIYHLLLNLGSALSNREIGDLSWALGVSITAGVLLAYHLRVMLHDQRDRAVAPAPASEGAAPASAAPETGAAALATLVLVTGIAADDVRAAIGPLAGRLPTGAELAVFPAAGVTPVELRAWLGGRAAPGSAPTPPTPQSDGPAGAQPSPA